MHLCLVVDKSSEVPHPGAEKGGGEEEVGSAKTFGCQSMPPQKTCFWFELAVLSKFCKSLLTYKIYFTQKSVISQHSLLNTIPIMFLFFFCQTENIRELALNEMMGGSLEVKQEDILEKV